MRNIVRWVERSAVGFSGAVGLIAKGDLPVANWMKPLADIIFPAVKTNAWWLTTISAGTVITTKFLKRSVLPDPWIENSLVAALDNGRDCLLDKNVIQTDDVHHHRLTLYRYTSFCYRPRPLRRYLWAWGWWRGPMSGWLVPEARSGHTTKKVKSTFLAPDDADACEGIVGRAWASNGLIFIDNLPEITSGSTDAEIKSYAKKTCVQEDWVRHKLKQPKPLARSFMGFVIKVDGKRWGVMIVDSIRPNGIVNPSNVQQQLVQLELFIDKIMGKGRS